jgi:hypothetical protein
VSNSQGQEPAGKRQRPPALAATDRYIVRIRGVPWECNKTHIENFFSGIEIIENGINLILGPNNEHTGKVVVPFGRSNLI